MAIEDDDAVDQAATDEYAIFQFKDVHTNDNSKIDIRWHGWSNRSTADSPVLLQIYNYDTTTWDTVDTENTAIANEHFDLTANLITDTAKYFDGSYVVTCRVYQEAA